MTPDHISFPCDPLEGLTTDNEFRRRTIEGVLESYNSNYDMLSEAIQNAVDAIEDAALTGLPKPYLLKVTVDLARNRLGVMDTGIGLTVPQMKNAFAPSISFKNDAALVGKRKSKGSYRGYKGVGLTYIAYGTDRAAMHSKRDGSLTTAKMDYGRSWATSKRSDSALMVEDTDQSPLLQHQRGTYVSMQFGTDTRPKSLKHVAADWSTWEVILRTRTAIGQVLMGLSPIVDIDVELEVIDTDGKITSKELTPTFLYPHEVIRTPPFRFLNLSEYYKQHSEQAEPPSDKMRQDGLYLTWDTARIQKELTKEQAAQFSDELRQYSPTVYAFIPYQGSVWADLNFILTGQKNRTHIYPGLIIAVNRQRLADAFETQPTRFETLNRNILTVVHFDNARPDQGRKSVQDEVRELAQKVADRALQYLAKQRRLLRAPGESPTPEQRQVEKDHQDWSFNVRTHAKLHAVHLPPLTYLSEPLTEQDVIGLFHQFAALGMFPGMKVYATSQSKTYDCLVHFSCDAGTPGLNYNSPDKYPLGVSPYVLGSKPKFETADLTLEFKNNLDALIEDVGNGINGSKKNFTHIDICVCWGKVSNAFPGFHLEPVTPQNIDQRRYPGVTHLLTRDEFSHVIQVIQLSTVVDLIRSGALSLPQV